MTNFVVQAQAAHKLIAEILTLEWDPIGVAGIASARDEYDAYIAEVYRLLSRRSSAQQLFEYLWWVETVHMGLNGDRQRTLNVSERLAQLIEIDLLPGST